MLSNTIKYDNTLNSVLKRVEKMTMLNWFDAIDATQNSRALLLSKISASCLIVALLHFKLSSKKNYVGSN